MEQHRGRRLVDLPRLDADEAVLDHVDPPHTVFSTDDVQGLDQVDAALLFAVEADGHAFDERDLELVRGRRDLLRVGRPLVDVAWRTTPRILEHTCFDRAAPKVFVDAVWALLRGLDRNAVLARVVDLLLAGHVHPAAHGRDHREIGRERADGEVEADLVVALASAAVRDKTRVLGTGGVDEQLREQRSSERRRERIALLVQRTRLQRRPHEVAHEDVAGVLDDRLTGPARDRLALDRLEIAGRAKIAGARRDFEPERLAQPGDRDRGVEAAGIGEHARLAVVPRHLPSLRAIPNGISWPSSDRACRSVDAATKTVSSPARVPTTSSRRDASRAAASAFAVPGSERKMTRFAAIAPSTG